MTTINQLPEVLQCLFGDDANHLARETGFIERQRKWTGAQFAQMVVFGWMEKPTASLSELQQMAQTCGCDVSIKTIATRLKEVEATDFLRRLLERGLALSQQRQPQPPATRLPFRRVVLFDSTQVSLPPALIALWRGGGNQHQARAGVKIQTTYDWQAGSLDFSLHPAVTNDRRLSLGTLTPMTLVVHDSGFLSVAHCRQVEAQASYWLARVSAQMGIVDAAGQYRTLSCFLQSFAADTDLIDQWVALTHQRHPVRLLAIRLPASVVEVRQQHLRAACLRRYHREPSAETLALCQWCVLATNATHELLSADHALLLYRSRWQIELLFKLWKQHGSLDEWRTDDPQRIQTELYAKLLMLLVQQWLLVETCWHFTDRSLLKALRWLRRHLVGLVKCLSQPAALRTFLLELAEGMVSCRSTKRRKRLAFFQLIEAFVEIT